MKELVEVFYEPGKVFDYVRERKAWVIAFVAGLVVFVCMLAYIYQAIGAGNITRHALEDSKFAAQMTQEQKETAIAKADTTAGKVQNISFATIGYIIVTVVFALLFMAVAAISSGKLSFPQAMGTVAYSGWPFLLLKFILSVVVIMIAANKADLDAQHLLAFNVGAFMDKATTAKPLYALATSLDLITLAQVLLSAYGLSKVALISFTKALVGLGLIWVFFTLIAMGLSLVF
jgi:uncharacterized membrane protein